MAENRAMQCPAGLMVKAEKKTNRHSSAIPVERSCFIVQFDRSSFFAAQEKMMATAQMRVAVTSRYSALMLVLPSVA